jgi:WD40 repeat protein
MHGLNAAEENQINLDTVIKSISADQAEMNVFFSVLSDKDLAHWSESSKYYRDLFKKELQKRKNLAGWAAEDLKALEFQCDTCTYQNTVFSSDGKKFAASSHTDQGFAIHVFDSESGILEKRIPVQGNVASLCFSPDDKILAVSDGIDKVFLFDINTDSRLVVDGTHMIFSHDGILTTVMREVKDLAHPNVCKWNIKTGEKMSMFALVDGDLINKNFMQLIFSPDGQEIVGGSDHNIIVWSCENGKRIKEFSNISISALAFSPDGKMLACKDGSIIKLLDFNTGENLKTFKGDFLSMVFLPDLDNKIFATAERMTGGEISIQIWDLVTGKSINDLRDEDLIGFVGLTASVEGKILAATSGKNIILWYRK